MKIDQKLISQLAKLSKLEFTKEELPKIEEDLTIVEENGETK